MNLLIICGDHKRNQASIEYIKKIKYINIVKIFIFKRDNDLPKPPKRLNKKIKQLWRLHFKKRKVSEDKNFKFLVDKNFEKEKIQYLNKIEDIFKFKKFIKNNKIDCCFISGIPVLSKKILDILPEYIVNLHLGLIPNYKGSITNFWPFLFLEPTMVGTTYHFINKEIENKNNKVDTGEILHNNVPKLKIGDSMHDVSTRAILTAIKDIHLVMRYVNSRIKKKLKPNYDNSIMSKGKLFLASDWKPEMLQFIYRTYKDKIVDLYLKKKIVCKKPKLKKIANFK